MLLSFLVSSFGKPSFMVCFYDHSFMTSLSSYSKDTINVDVLKVLRKALYIQPGKRMKVKGYGLSYSSPLHSLARDWTTRSLPAHCVIIQRVFVEEKSAISRSCPIHSDEEEVRDEAACCASSYWYVPIPDLQTLP